MGTREFKVTGLPYLIVYQRASATDLDDSDNRTFRKKISVTRAGEPHAKYQC